MKKRILALGLALVMVCAFCGCGKDVTEAPASGDGGESSAGGENSGLKIGLVLNVGGLGDNNVNDMVYNGIRAAADELDIKLDYVEPTETADIELYLTDFAKDGSYDLVVTLSALAASPLKNVAALYPDQKFLLVDNPVRDMENVASLTYSKPHEGFLSGVACAYMANAASVTVDGTEIPLDNSAKALGCILGVENPDGLEAISGFRAGVKYVDPEVNILYAAVGSWSDQASAREIALAQYDQGAQMVFQDSGTSSLGVFTAAADRGLFTMGWNMPQHLNDPSHILFSVVKDVTNTTKDWILNWASSGNFTSGEINYSCVGGYIYVIWSDLFDVPEDMKKAVDGAFEMLSNNEIEIPYTLEGVEEFDLRIGG